MNCLDIGAVHQKTVLTGVQTGNPAPSQMDLKYVSVVKKFPLHTFNSEDFTINFFWLYELSTSAP